VDSLSRISVALAVPMALWLLNHSPMGPRVFFYVGSLFAVWIVAWGCVGVGGMGFKALRIKTHASEALPLHFALGQGILGLLILGLGLAGVLSLPGVPQGCLVVLGTLAYVSLRQGNGTSFLRVRFLGGAGESCMAAAALTGLALMVLLCFLPPFEYDVLGYHLALPKRWLNMGRIHWTPDHVFSAFPLLAEMFFYLGLSWGQEAFANLWVLVNTLFLALFLAGSCRDDQDRCSWLAPAILLCSPLCLRTGCSAYNDLPLALYEVMGLLLLLRGLRSRQTSWVIAAGLLTGFGMGVKYHGFLFGWALSCLAGWGLVRRRETLRSLALFSWVAWLAASPWLVRNLVWTGNPFFPLFGGWLGGGMLPAHVEAFSRAHAPPSFHGSSIVAALGEICLSLGGTLVLLPWAFSRSREKGASFAWILGLWGLTLAIWMIGTNRVDRFLCYSLVLAALFLGRAWLVGQGKTSWCIRWPAGLVAGMGWIQLLAFGATCEALGLWSPVLGRQSRDDFLAGHVQCHGISRLLGEVVQPGERVLLVGEARTYPFDVDVSTSYPFSTPPIVCWMEKTRTASELRDALRMEGYAFVLVNVPSAERLSQAYAYFHPYDRLWEEERFVEWLRSTCVLVGEDRGIQLYRLIRNPT